MSLGSRRRAWTAVLGDWLWAGGFVAVAAVMLWALVFEPVTSRGSSLRQIRTDIRSLANRPPAGVTPSQWEKVIFWTLNAHSNTITSNPSIPRAELRRFAAELHERMRGEVTLKLIDWIWDEFVRLEPTWGPHYSETYRPTSPEKLAAFERGDDW